MSGLEMWVVYDHPNDLPNDFVARRWVVTSTGTTASDEVVTGPTLEAVRSALSPALVCLPRMPEDDEKIVEVWM